MNEFELMEPVVAAICESLENEPERWVFGVTTIQHKSKFNNMEFWISTSSICERWNGRDNTRVFSSEQGRRIYESYKISKNKVGSEAQKALLKSIGQPVKNQLKKRNQHGFHSVG